MSQNRLKVQFFESELSILLTFKQNLESINSLIKRKLFVSEPTISQSFSSLQEISKKISQQLAMLKKEIKQYSCGNLLYDESMIEQQMVYSFKEQKIQDLNERLYEAEQNLQKAQILSKNVNKNEYEMSRNKNFKKVNETLHIQKYVQAQNRVVNQFCRSFNLMLKVQELSKNQSKDNEFMKMLKLKSNEVPFWAIKNNKKTEQRQWRSCQTPKYSNLSPSKIAKNTKQLPFILHLLLSKNLRQRPQCELALKKLIQKTKQSNKQQTELNKILTQAIQLKKKQQVFQYLCSKSDLNEQESIMKIEVVAQKLNSNLKQRFTSLKTNRISAQFHAGDNRTFEKRLKPKRLHSQNQKKIKKTKPKQSPLKKHGQNFASIPKTNDSLSTANIFTHL